ncbi:hypothetical protein BN14_05457 [Rhizoctonia solani AG-1 IB]|uniref:Heme haloperoxidase family profile domain-containing protein n=1 Tax=Thanatephorus cucumeris (strain AG1-IB / isolate 7/3/14) TaxID=1108050 RepID=M5BXT6_THACB|nr:hypothetical protein BN14_05457 [Rhizoctonia solani AG-1 IB]
MRFLSTAIPFILAASAVAFAAMDNYIPTGTAPGCPYAANAAKLKRQSNGASPTAANFDPIKQKVDALANHGYIPHNGVASLLETVEAAYDVFGIDKVLAMMLVTYAIIFTGSPATLTWSIGESPGGLVIPPLLSAPQGLSGSHNKYEDSSTVYSLRGLMPTLTMILLFNTGSAGAGTPYQRILSKLEEPQLC